MLAIGLPLVAMPTAVPIAREFTRSTLEHLPQREAANNAELIVSELVSNAVAATGITMKTSLCDITRHHLIRLAFTLTAEVLLIEVWDGQDGEPRLTAVADDAEHGRGLLIVQALSRDWGTVRSPNGGESVWSLIALHGESPADARGEAARTPPAPAELPQRVRPRAEEAASSMAPPITRFGDARLRRVIRGLQRL